MQESTAKSDTELYLAGVLRPDPEYWRVRTEIFGSPLQARSQQPSPNWRSLGVLPDHNAAVPDLLLAEKVLQNYFSRQHRRRRHRR